MAGKGAAPRVGDDAVSSRLYAGKPEYPALLVRYADSDNASGAENQQETGDASLKDPQRPYAGLLLVMGEEEMVRSLRRRRGLIGTPLVNPFDREPRRSSET